MESREAPTPGQDASWAALRDRVSITLRPVGSPVSVGFFGLAAASLTLGGLQLGWIPLNQARQVGLIVMGFAFLAQLLAAIFSLLARDATSGTAMTTLALTWLVTGLILVTGQPGATSRALGLFLLFSAIAMALSAATAALSKLVPALIFATAALRFLATALHQLTDALAWQRTAGVIGLLLCALALYGAWAADLEAAVKKPVLPLGRRGRARVAVQGSLFEEVQNIANEPGVRQQL